MNPDRDWRYSENLDGTKVDEVKTYSNRHPAIDQYMRESEGLRIKADSGSVYTPFHCGNVDCLNVGAQCREKPNAKEHCVRGAFCVHCGRAFCIIDKLEADAQADNRQSLYHFRIDSSGPELRKVQPLTMAGVYGDYFDKPANRVEIVKAYLSEMPQDEREEIYRWLHDTWNCRVYK